MSAYTVRSVWEGDVMVKTDHLTLASALEGAAEAVKLADATTVERGICGDTVVQIIDEGNDVLSEVIVPGIDHRVEGDK